MPGAEQSQIRIGAVGVARSTPDYFALQVLNTVLGGSFTSRLNQNLREEHGYAYGAGSRFDMRLAAGPFTASAGVQTDKTAESLTEFFNELEAIAAPIGADELAKAKNYLALGFPGDFETLGDLAARLEELVDLWSAGQLLRRVHGQYRGRHGGRRAAGSRAPIFGRTTSLSSSSAIDGRSSLAFAPWISGPCEWSGWTRSCPSRALERVLVSRAACDWLRSSARATAAL